jgi:hypothetical protein
MDLFLIVVALIAGYVAAIYSWPALRPFLLGAEEEIAQLRQRARDLERRLRG